MSCPLHEPPRPPLGYRAMQAMAGPLLKRMRLSCRDFANLASQRLDHPLTASERFRYHFHALLCSVCRRLPEQFELIRSSLHDCGSDGSDGEEEPKAELDAAARERLRTRLALAGADKGRIFPS